MCPACFATIALLAAGVVSTGGVTAATVKLFRDRKTTARISETRKSEVSKDKEKSE